MIELYYWPTPNGHKITMFLEETGLPYRIVPVNIGAGAQFEPAFLAIAPNNRMPAIVDTAPQGGGAPLSVFESGAILLYLAEKTGAAAAARTARALRGASSGCSGRWQAWVPWRARTTTSPATRRRSSPTPSRATSTRPTASTECSTSASRDRAYVGGGDYSIADIACYPWIVPHEAQGQKLEDFPHLQALVRGDPRAGPRRCAPTRRRRASAPRARMSEEAKKILFGQTAR